MKKIVKILFALMLGAMVVFASVACDLDEDETGYVDEDETEAEEVLENDGNGDGDVDDIVVNEDGEIDPDASDDTINPGGASVRPYPGAAK